MSKSVSIDQIDSLAEHDKLYVLIAGGIASGKNHIVSANIKTIDMMDVDDVMEELGYTDYNSHQFHDAMGIIASRIKEKFECHESIIAMGTSSNLPFSIDKLYGAKEHGYKTVLVHIDASTEQCLAQNEERRKKGKRAVGVDELYKIERTNAGAAMVVANLKDTMLVDYYTHYVNIR